MNGANKYSFPRTVTWRGRTVLSDGAIRGPINPISLVKQHRPLRADHIRRSPNPGIENVVFGGAVAGAGSFVFICSARASRLGASQRLTSRSESEVGLRDLIHTDRSCSCCFCLVSFRA